MPIVEYAKSCELTDGVGPLDVKENGCSNHRSARACGFSNKPIAVMVGMRSGTAARI